MYWLVLWLVFWLVFVKVLVLSWPGRGGRQSRVLPIPWWAIGLDGSGPFCGIFTDLIGEYCRPGPYLAIWYPDFLATPNCRLPLQNTPEKLNYILR